MPRLALLALAVCLGGCGPLAEWGLLDRTPPPKRVYKLETTAKQAEGPVKALTIGLGPVTLPGYLDRLRIVTRVRPDTLEAAPDDGWSEPLDRALPRVLGEDLALLIPVEPGAVQATRKDRKPQYQVIVDIRRLDGPLTGEMTLLARWRLLDGGANELASKETKVTRPSGGTYPAIAAGYGFMLEGLARAIAAEIKGLQAK
jgi:uncharacterized lipoprotein YmbA